MRPSRSKTRCARLASSREWSRRKPCICTRGVTITLRHHRRTLSRGDRVGEVLPNFHFHAVTAYDILRLKGVPLGKRDYEGQLRTRAV
jgi:hypothetical protein